MSATHTDSRASVATSGFTHQEDIVHSSLLRKFMALGRIFVGWLFLWAFLDKLFGLGFSTPAERAWINGGTPAQGFMSNAKGVFGGFFNSISGPWADWLFMAGLLGIGIAMVLGAGLKLAAWTGTLLVGLMYLAQFPIGQPEDVTSTNPIMTSHWIEAALLLISAYGLAGDTWGLGKWWASKVGDGVLR